MVSGPIQFYPNEDIIVQFYSKMGGIGRRIPLTQTNYEQFSVKKFVCSDFIFKILYFKEKKRKILTKNFPIFLRECLYSPNFFSSIKSSETCHQILSSKSEKRKMSTKLFKKTLFWKSPYLFLEMLNMEKKSGNQFFFILKIIGKKIEHFCISMKLA